MDPLDLLTQSWTPYRYGYDNPMRFVDVRGFTEKERLRLVSEIKHLYAEGVTRGQVLDDLARLKAYSLADCASVVRTALVRMGLPDPNMMFGLSPGPFERNSGVENLVAMGLFQHYQGYGFNEIKEGMIVVIASRQGGSAFNHVGVVGSWIEKDAEGNVRDFELYELPGRRPNDGSKMRRTSWLEYTSKQVPGAKFTAAFDVTNPEPDGSEIPHTVDRGGLIIKTKKGFEWAPER